MKYIGNQCILTVYYHLLQSEHRGNPRCSLPSVPISSCLFCRPWLLQPFPKLSHLQVPMTTNTMNVAHSFSLLTCLKFALHLFHLPCIFCDIPGTHAPAHNLYCCCHFWVTSGLSDRNDCSCCCPLHIIRKHYRNKNTVYIYTSKTSVSWHLCNILLLPLLTISNSSPSKEEGIWCTFSEVF